MWWLGTPFETRTATDVACCYWLQQDDLVNISRHNELSAQEIQYSARVF